MEYYKVVSVKNNKYYSALKDNLGDVSLEYQLGKVVKPLIGKIFVFDRYDYAELFAKHIMCSEYSKYEIAILKGKGVKSRIKLNTIVEVAFCNFYQESIKRFWKNIEYKYDTCFYPYSEPMFGTVFLNSFLPEERVG